MARIITNSFVTLDGVIQAPGRPDEDTRGGFTHGGWAGPYNDEVMAAQAGRGMVESGALLLGRRTYEDFHGFWTKQPEPNPFTEVLNTKQKYVASTTLEAPLPWQNSTLLSGDVVGAVRELREQPGKDIVILGSGKLIRSLAARDLIDQYTLLIHPLVLGMGQRLFADAGTMASLQLVDSVTTTTGVIIATYQPANTAGEVARQEPHDDAN